MNRKQKKIILIVGNFPYGGAAANLLRYFSLSLALQQNQIEVIIPVGNSYGIKNKYNSIRKGTIEGVPYRHLGFLNHPKNYLGKVLDIIGSIFLPVFYLIIKSLKSEVDIIIIYNSTFFRNLRYLVLKTVLRKKLVIIDPEFYQKPPAGFSLAYYKWYNFYFGIKYMARYADGFIVLSSFLKDYIQGRLNKQKPFLIMPNLIDPDIFAKKSETPFLNGKLTIGFCGALDRKDGVTDLIKSFSILNKKYPDTHLLIIGDNQNGASSLVPRQKSYAREVGVEENITFTGLVDYSKIPDLLNSCQILALARPNGIFAEAGFPTKLGEYFCCRKPVVVTKVGDIRKYFTHKEDVILVEPENIESIVEGFKLLLENNDLFEKLSTNAYKWMDENLNYRNVSEKIDRFLDEI